jgi:hypothetical protein
MAQKLLDWFSNHGFYIADTVKITTSPLGGLGVVALNSFPAGSNELLLRIPKDLILSVRNCSISHLLEQAGLTDATGLIVALLHETSLGEKSVWHDYISSLPQRADVPILWTEEELEQLDGTEIGWGDIIRKDKTAMCADFEQLVQPLVHAFPDLLPASHVNQEMYLNAASLVSSRAFFVDEEHGEALVPLADLLNTHSQTEHTSTCSSHGEAELLEEGDGSIACPALHVSMGTPMVGEKRESVLEIRATKSIAKGEEILNCYGVHGNAGSLVVYGFTEKNNPQVVYNTFPSL